MPQQAIETRHQVNLRKQQRLYDRVVQEFFGVENRLSQHQRRLHSLNFLGPFSLGAFELVETTDIDPILVKWKRRSVITVCR